MKTRNRTRPRSHPGRVFKNVVVEQSELTCQEIADKAGLPLATLEKFLNCELGVTSEIAEALARVSGMSKHWLGLQEAYNESVEPNSTVAVKELEPQAA